jgi:hypothetical protein
VLLSVFVNVRKARHLLAAFPLDATNLDGSPFWSSPKRPPRPILFNGTDLDHRLFVIATARLVAERHGQ